MRTSENFKAHYQQRRWLPFFLILFCFVCPATLSEENILRVWGPKVHETRSDAQLPLIRTLAEITGRKVDFNVSLDTDSLLQACAQYQVDHALLEQSLAEKIIREYGYKAIAIGTIKVALFTRDQTTRDISKLSKIAYIQRTSGRRIALNEQSISYLGEKLVPYDTFHHAVFALLNKEVDGLISNERLISGLTENLKKQIRKRYQFTDTAGAVFIVSPHLDRATAKTLQALYLSDHPVIEELFYQRAGLEPIQKISLDTPDSVTGP